MAAQRLLIHIEIHYENEALFIGETNYQEGYFWLHQGDDLALDLDIREIRSAGRTSFTRPKLAQKHAVQKVVLV